MINLNEYFKNLLVSVCFIGGVSACVSPAVSEQIPPSEETFHTSAETLCKSSPFTENNMKRAKEDQNQQHQDDRNINEESLADKSYRLIGAIFEGPFRHSQVSHIIENYSQRIDYFFGKETIYEESTESFVSLKAFTLYDRDDALSLDGRFRVKLNLPRTEDRFQLQFASPDNQQSEETEGYQGTQTTASGVKASLHYVLQRTRRWNVSISPGIKLRTPPDSYLKLRIRRSFGLVAWDARIIQSFEWHDATGYGSRSTFILDRTFLDDFLFRLKSEGYRNEEEFAHRDFQISQKAVLYYQWSSRSVISAAAGLYGKTEPSWQDERYFCSVSWRKNIHKGFLFLELRPQVDFARENDFRGDLSTTLSLEVLYGAQYL